MNALNDLRQFDEAIAVGEETVASQRRTLGPAHPTTVNCQVLVSWLAFCLSSCVCVCVCVFCVFSFFRIVRMGFASRT